MHCVLYLPKAAHRMHCVLYLPKASAQLLPLIWTLIYIYITIYITIIYTYICNICTFLNIHTQVQPLFGGKVDLSLWSLRCRLKENEAQRRRNANNFAGTCSSRSWNPWVLIYFLELEMPLKVKIRPIGPLDSFGMFHDLPFIKITNSIIFLLERLLKARGHLEPCRPCGKSCWTGPRNPPRQEHSCVRDVTPAIFFVQVVYSPTGFNIYFNFNTLCTDFHLARQHKNTLTVSAAEWKNMNTLFFNMFYNVCRIATFADL